MQQNVEFVHKSMLVPLEPEKRRVMGRGGGEHEFFRMIRRAPDGSYMGAELGTVLTVSDVPKADFSKTRVGQIMAGISWGRNRRELSKK